MVAGGQALARLHSQDGATQPGLDALTAALADAGRPLVVVERKPRYVDFASAALCRTLTRFLGHAPSVEFTEILPAPDECWLSSDAGRHTSELRVVAFDRSR